MLPKACSVSTEIRKGWWITVIAAMGVMGKPAAPQHSVPSAMGWHCKHRPALPRGTQLLPTGPASSPSTSPVVPIPREANSPIVHKPRQEILPTCHSQSQTHQLLCSYGWAGPMSSLRGKLTKGPTLPLPLRESKQ